MVQSIKGQKSIANCISRLQQKPLLQQIAFQDFKIAKFKILMFKLYSATEGPSFHTTTAPPAWSLQVVQQVVAAAASVAVAPPPLPCSSCWRPLASCRHQTNQANRTPFHMQKDKTKKFMHRCIDVKQLSSTWSPAAGARAAWASSCSAASSWSGAA